MPFQAAIAALCVSALLTVAAASLPIPNQIEEGKRVFAMNCSVGYCHGLEGRAGKGPRLRDRVWSRSYLRNTIEKGIPNSSMPPWRGRLTDHRIDAVVAYILSIARQQPDAESPEAGEESVPSKEPVSEEATQGKALFFDPMKDRNCGVCHRVDGSGAPIAAAFDSLPTTSDQDLLRQILGAPNGSKTLKVVTADGEIICGIDAGESGSLRRIYDLASSGPPVLRTIDSASIRRVEPCTAFNVHQANSRSFSTDELKRIVAFLKSSAAAKPR